MAKWTWNGAEFDAKRLTVRDELSITHLSARLQEATGSQSREAYYWCNTFARFAITTTLISGNPGLSLVNRDDDDQIIVDAMNAWLDAEGWLDPWEEALARANEAPNRPELQPGTEKNASAPSKGKGGANS